MQKIYNKSFPDPHEDVVKQFPYILCLAVERKNWKKLKKDPYRSFVQLFAPTIEEYHTNPSLLTRDISKPEHKHRCFTVGCDEEIRYSCKKLEDLRIVTVEEFRVIWNQLCNAQLMDIKQCTDFISYKYEDSDMFKWNSISCVLKESYRIVYYTAVVKLVEKMALLKYDGYCHFLRLFDLVIISQLAISNMLTEMFKCKEPREYYSLFKKWIVAVDKLHTQYSAFYLDIIKAENTNKLLALPKDVISFTKEEQNLLHKLTRENLRRIQVRRRVRTMLKDFLAPPAGSPQEYLHFDLLGPKDYFLNEYKDEKCTNALLHLLTLVPALPLVVRNFFPNIIPQTVTVELPPNDAADKPRDDNWLLECLLNVFEAKGTNLYWFWLPGLETYMAVITLCSYDSYEQQASKNLLQYLQPVTNLSDHDFGKLNTPDKDGNIESKSMIETDTFYEKIFEKCSERACKMFCEEINSTLNFGTLLIYFHVLKNYLSKKQAKRLEEELRQRQEAEQTFLEYFYDPEQRKHATIRYWTEVYPYVFFLSFVKVFLFHTQDDQKEGQQQCINRLVDTLESFPNLKELLTRQRISSKMYFHEFLYKKLTISKKSAPLEQLKRICSSEWGNVLSGASQIRFKSYEESSLTKVEVLSEGGQAVVELVTAPGLPVPVAAKLFIGVLASSHGLHASFLQLKDEIRTLLTTQCNPHIVSLYGYVVDKHRIKGLLMENCKGGSLDSVIKSTEDYSESSIIRWSLHAACGLDFIHTSNSIHRDVKPSNMLLDEYHQLLKISDLGIVKMGTIISDVLHCENTSDSGTPGYRAPEIIYGDVKTCTPKVDVFGLGRSIWKMIFRCNPKDTLDETLAMKVIVSPAIWAYVQRMMAHKRDSRPTMAEVYTFFEGQEQPPTPTDRQEGPSQELQPKRLKHADKILPTKQSISLEDIVTQPAGRIMINAPFDEKLAYLVKLTNISDRHVGWIAKISNLARLNLNPVHGRLGSNETTRITISCDFFAYDQEEISDDCIIIEWTSIPLDSDEQFCHEWFQDAGVVRKKKLPIEYNP